MEQIPSTTEHIWSPEEDRDTQFKAYQGILSYIFFVNK